MGDRLPDGGPDPAQLPLDVSKQTEKLRLRLP
jgi:hypothetical protein